MISIDGWSRSGKTTQSQILSESLEIPIITWDNYFIDFPFSGYETFESVARSYCNLVHFLTDAPDEFVLDTCWFGLIRSLAHKEIKESIILIDIFHEIIKGLIQKEPICFYLSVPQSLADHRSDKREGKIVEEKRNFETSSYDEKMTEVIEYLSRRFDFFHIIDGSLPVYDITQMIRGYLEKH